MKPFTCQIYLNIYKFVTGIKYGTIESSVTDLLTMELNLSCYLWRNKVRKLRFDILSQNAETLESKLAPLVRYAVYFFELCNFNHEILGSYCNFF